MQTLYPSIKPYNTQQIETSDGHSLYVIEAGNPDGLPVLVCHDGPGLGSQTHTRRYFDPEMYRIIQFDQRGCGHSKPHLDIETNNIETLVNDIERMRQQFGIERWVVCGGGFGAKLALSYVIVHRDVAAGLLLWSVSLPGKRENQWRFHAGGGASEVFPDLFKEFAEHVPKEERNDLLEAYHKRLTGSDDIVRMAAAKAWYAWIHGCSSFYSSEATAHHTPDNTQCLNVATLSAHYAKNEYFSSEQSLLAGCKKLGSLPGYVVQGRYDLLSPLASAWRICGNWPGSKLAIVREAGHSDLELPMVHAIVQATKSLATVSLS